MLDFGADDLTTSPARDHSDEIQLARRRPTSCCSRIRHLTCPEYAAIAADTLTRPLDDPNYRVASTDRGTTRASTVGLAAGVDLNQYNYLAEGDDMVDLIRALHLTHVHLVSGYVAYDRRARGRASAARRRTHAHTAGAGRARTERLDESGEVPVGRIQQLRLVVSSGSGLQGDVPRPLPANIAETMTPPRAHHSWFKATTATDSSTTCCSTPTV